MNGYSRLNGIKPCDWRKLQDRVLIRDKHICRRCHEHYRGKNGFVVGHILPIADGGRNDLDNLITLCLDCREYVNKNKIKTLEGIEASVDVYNIDTKIKPFGYADRTRPDWHKYVYGGARKAK